VGEGWVPQQVIVMENHLGRNLEPDEEVKHLNGNVHDNRVENLRVVRPQFGVASNSLFESQESARNLSKNFIPCKFQRPCWKEVRSKIARENKVYLPYICDYQVSGDIYQCGHYWKFRERDIAEKGADKIE
jgi:hypothetical protein